MASPVDLETRRSAVVAALRAVAADARPGPVRTAPTPTPAPTPTTTTTTTPAPVAAVAPELAELREHVHRLTTRLDRLEDKVDLIRDGDETPLAWPVAITDNDRLEVPPLDLGRSNSPAYDVLLGGPSRREDSA